jgi:hypothetical protein
MRTLARTRWIPLHLHPHLLASWSQRELEVLLRMRKNHPNGQVFQDRQKQKRAEEADHRRLMVTWQEMEELAVRCGLSRIQFHRAKAEVGPLPLDMSPDTWEKDPKCRRWLYSMRETEKFMETAKYQKCLQTGQVLPSAQGASAMLSRLMSWKPPSTEPRGRQHADEDRRILSSPGKEGRRKSSSPEGGRQWWGLEASGARECLGVVEF